MAVAADHHGDLGIGGVELLIDLRELGFKGVPHDAQGQGTPVAFLCQAGGHHAAPVLIQDLGALLEKGAARRSQSYAAGVAVKKLNIQLLLQSGDQAAQSGLGHEQVVRRLGEVQALGQYHKAFQLIQRHRGSLRFSTSMSISKTGRLVTDDFM